jgi:hypothetical protein
MLADSSQPFDASTMLSIYPELGRRVDPAQGLEALERLIARYIKQSN